MSLRSRNKVSVAFNMSSMTDIVFLLLIFFIILSTLVSPYSKAVNLPDGENRTPDHPQIAVTINKDLTYLVGDDPITPAELEQLLQERKPELLKAQVLLRIDQDVPTGDMVKFLTLVRRNEYEVVVATRPEDVNAIQ